MLKAAIFDVDGTLIDSNDLHTQAWQSAFRHFGHEISYNRLRRQLGKGADNYVPYFLTPEENAKIGTEVAQYKARLFKSEYASRIRPFPCVRELFERIGAEGLRIGLATSANEEELQRHLRLLKVEDLVEASSSSRDVRHSKPSPDVFTATLEQIGMEPGSAIAIGDTPYDAQACGKIGLRMIGVLCGGFSQQELREAGCFAIYRDPADLLLRFEESPLNTQQAA